MQIGTIAKASRCLSVLNPVTMSIMVVGVVGVVGVVVVYAISNAEEGEVCINKDGINFSWRKTCLRVFKKAI